MNAVDIIITIMYYDNIIMMLYCLQEKFYVNVKVARSIILYMQAQAFHH